MRGGEGALAVTTDRRRTKKHLSRFFQIYHVLRVTFTGFSIRPLSPPRNAVHGESPVGGVASTRGVGDSTTALSGVWRTRNRGELLLRAVLAKQSKLLANVLGRLRIVKLQGYNDLLLLGPKNVCTTLPGSVSRAVYNRPDTIHPRQAATTIALSAWLPALFTRRSSSLAY